MTPTEAREQRQRLFNAMVYILGDLSQRIDDPVLFNHRLEYMGTMVGIYHTRIKPPAPTIVDPCDDDEL